MHYKLVVVAVDGGLQLALLHCSKRALPNKINNNVGIQILPDLLKEFAAQVARQPHATAVAEPDSSLSFEQMDAASDRLAHLLHDQRQSENDINGYLGPISIHSVTANLACFKAGQCIAALDPRHPVQVLADLVRHSGMARLLVGPGMDDLAAALHGTGVPQVAMPTDTPDRATIPAFAPVDADPESLSTIVYTSGSTGRPKGSVNPRQFFLDRWERNRASGFQPGDVGASFWAFRWEDQLRMLCDGVRQECFDFGRLGPVALAAWINERRVTNLVSYMFLYRQMCAAAMEGLPHIRRIFLLGEPIVRSDLELFNEKFRPGAELISRFGSSEYGAMTVYTYRHGEPIRHDVLPIGKPIHAGTLFLLDEHGEEVPQGELGEVTFSTPMVPHGYHNDPERSAKVFMPDHNRPGHWRYHTGDLGFLDENGDVTVVGRKDEQVKVRGYTVRPHEVEQMLVEHPGVALAGVVPFTGRQGNTQIAAFFQPADAAAVPEAADLRAFMNERAPGFMVPSAFLSVPEMPLSPNGKVARGRLPDPLSLLDEAVSARHLAQSATEKELVRIWSKVLGHGRFTLADDFFDMGGDSLQAMSMVTEIEAALKIKLPFESLMLDGASIAVMARRIDADKEHGIASYVTELKRGKDRPALFAAHVIGGHLSDYLEVVTGLHPDRPVIGIHPRGMAGKERPDFSMQGLARHCIAEMRKVQPDGPFHLLGYSFGARLCVEIANQLVAAGQAVGSLVMIDPQPPSGEPGARARAVHRPLREGSISLAMARLLNTVPAAMGLREAPGKIDEAHLVASLAYRPEPLALPHVLIVFASGNPYLDIARSEWQRVLGGNAKIEVEEGSHMDVVRGAAGQAMGRKIEAWLGEAVAPPAPAATTAEPESQLLAG